ncbi:unnamed protein product [Schistosoma haematobium]|nr:unnamed protein product [Schistosoma haematobium]
MFHNTLRLVQMVYKLCWIMLFITILHVRKFCIGCCTVPFEVNFANDENIVKKKKKKKRFFVDNELYPS